MLAQTYEWQHEVVVTVHNLAEEPCTLTLDLSYYDGDNLEALFGNGETERVDEDSYDVRLKEFGHQWYRVDSGQN